MAAGYLDFSSLERYRWAHVSRAVHKVVRLYDPRRSYPKVLRSTLIPRDDSRLAGSIRVTAEMQSLIQTTLTAEIANRTSLWSDGELIDLNIANALLSVVPVGDLVTDVDLPVSNGTHPLIVAAGQSNSVGLGVGHEITAWPVEQRTALSNTLYSAWLHAAAETEWTHLKPMTESGSGEVRGNQSLTMMHRLRATWPRVALMHGAAGGTNLAVQWADGGTYWELFKYWAQCEIDNSPVPLSPQAFVWDQGESDCTALFGAAYEANLTALIARVRALFSAPAMRVIIRGMPTTYLAGPPATLVHNAQLAVSAADPLVHVIPGDDFYPPGEMHANATQSQIFGTRIADKILEVCGGV